MKKNLKNVLLTISIIVTLAIVYIYRDSIMNFINILHDQDSLKKYFMSMGFLGGMLFFIFLHIVQVVAFFLPGNIVQVLGGYLYGTFLGTVLSSIGIMIGSALLFFISKKFNSKFNNIVKKNGMYNRTKDILCNTKSKFIILLIYFIPGMPKDNMIYVCTLTDMSFKTFIIYSTLGRIPEIYITSLIGAQVDKGNTSIAISLIISICIIFVIAIIKKDVIINKIMKYEEL